MSVNIYDSSTDTLTRVDNSSGSLVKTTVAKTGADQSAVTDTIAASTTMDNAIGTLLNNDVTLGSDIQTLTNETNDIVNVLGAKNLLQNTATSQTANGITYIVNSDGSVALSSGTCTAWTALNLNIFSLKKGKYILSSTTNIPQNVYLTVVNNSTSDTIAYIQQGDNDVEFILANDTTVKVYIGVSAGVISGVTLYPMIRPASIADDTYVPYAMTNHELTSQRIKVVTTIATTDANGFLLYVFPTSAIVLNAWTTTSDRYCEYYPSNGSTSKGRAEWWFRIMNANNEQPVPNTEFTVHIAYICL